MGGKETQDEVKLIIQPGDGVAPVVKAITKAKKTVDIVIFRFDRAEIEEIKLLRRERAAGSDETAFRKYFRRDLHAGLVRNLRKVGVLTPRIEPDIASLGISLAA